jgi:hypothetical protein
MREPNLVIGTAPYDAEAITAADGAFAVTLIPGEYLLTVKADHYLTQEYGQRVFGGKGKRIIVRAGESVGGVDLRLTKSGTISGTVVDAAGAPMAKVAVQAFVREYVLRDDMHWRLSGTSLSLTDDQGRYSLRDLNPDNYYVRAFVQTNPLLREATQAGVRTAPREGYLPRFYPDTADPAAAGVIRVPPAGEIHGIQVTVRSTFSASLSGTVVLPAEAPGVGNNTTGAAQGPAVFTSQIALIPVGLHDVSETRAVYATSDDGTFRFGNLLPGEYRIIAASDPAGRLLSVVQSVDIQPGRNSEVTLALQPALDVAGRLIVDGQAPAAFDPAKVLVGLTLVGDYTRFDDIRRDVLAPANPDGTFVIRGVIPGAQYTLSISSRGNESPYVSRVLYGAWDAWPVPMTISKGAPPISVHVGFGRGWVEATVVDGKQPIEGAQVVLTSVDHPPRYAAAVTDREGKVRLPSETPGQYELFAWESAKYGDWLDPDFMSAFAGKGKRIVIEAGKSASEVIQVLD